MTSSTSETIESDVQVQPRQDLPYAQHQDGPFIFFDHVSSYGILDGVAQITIEARRQRCEQGTTVLVDRVIVANLRCGLSALALLRSSIDGVLLLNEPVQVGKAN